MNSVYMMSAHIPCTKHEMEVTHILHGSEQQGNSPKSMSPIRTTFVEVSANLRCGVMPPPIHTQSFIRHAFRTMNPIAQLVMLACIVLTFMAVAAFVGLMWVTGGNVGEMELLTQPNPWDARQGIHVGHEQREPTLGISGASLAFAWLVGSAFLAVFLKKPSWLMLRLANHGVG